MEGHEDGRLVRTEEFTTEIREPYMGNTVPLTIIVKTMYRSGFHSVVEVQGPEDFRRVATLFNRKTPDDV